MFELIGALFYRGGTRAHAGTLDVLVSARSGAFLNPLFP